MSDLKQPSNFPDVSIEDTISLTLGSIEDSSKVEFQLESDTSVTWWKAIEVYASNNAKLGSAETHDNDHGPHTFSLVANDLVGARLVLAKAKTFGVHTGMYRLENLSSFQGRSFQFLWQRDDDKDGPVAGFFRDLGNGIGAAADAVADVVETVVEDVAEVVDTVVEGVGTFVADVLDAVGNFLGEIPVVGGVFKFIFHYVATVVSAFMDFLAVYIKAIGDAFANIVAGITRVVGGFFKGIMTGDWLLFREGIGDIIAGIVGGVVAIVAKLWALVQAALFMQLGERPLTRAESAMLARVYRGSVALYNVRVIDGFVGLFSTNTRPFTLGNKIYMKDTAPVSYNHTLVHECCHVWQNQHLGTRYLADALWGQATLPGQGYSWRDELDRGHSRWQDFNREAAAAFLEDIFTLGKKVPTTHVAGEFYDDDPTGPDVKFMDGATDRTGLARDSVLYVRGAGWPWHAWW